MYQILLTLFSSLVFVSSMYAHNLMLSEESCIEHCDEDGAGEYCTVLTNTSSNENDLLKIKMFHSSFGEMEDELKGGACLSSYDDDDALLNVEYSVTNASGEDLIEKVKLENRQELACDQAACVINEHDSQNRSGW